MRAKAGQGQLVIIRPDGKYLLLPALSKNATRPESIAAIEKMLPSTIKRNIAVIGDTTWATSAAPNIQMANQAIPFFGLLMGFGTIGHSVWIFDGSNETLLAGCRDANLLIVDSKCLPALPENWETNTAKVMNKPQILIHDRATYKLRKP